MAIAPRQSTTRAGAALGVLLSIAVFAYLLSFPMYLNQSDEALFLYGAKRILSGEALYHDFFEFITPAGFYLFAFVFAVGGTSMVAARTAMAALDALSCVFLFSLTCKVAGTVEAALAVVVFAAAFLPVWHMASPHWVSTTLCLASATVLLGGPAAGPSAARAAAAGGVAGLVFSTQQQRGTFLALWLAASVSALAWGGAGAGDRWRRVARALVWAAIGWATVVATVLGYAVSRSSLHEVWYAIFTFVVRQYGTHIAGIIPWGGADALNRPSLDRTWPWLARAFPAIFVVEGVGVVVALYRDGARETIVRGSLLLLAVLMALSVLYFPDVIHVAFIAPFGLIVIARWVHAIRSMALRAPSALPRAAVVAALAVCFAAAFHKGWTNWQVAYEQTPVRFATAFGTIAGDDGLRQIFDDVRNAMSTVPADRRTFFSYPADSWLYLTVPGTNPTPFSFFVRGYNTADQMRRLEEAIELRRPDFVVVNLAFVRPDDPFLAFLKDRYERRAAAGIWQIHVVYARLDRREGGAAPEASP